MTNRRDRDTEVTPEEKEALTGAKNLTTRGIPADLFREFKAQCAADDITMTDQVIRMIRKCVDGKGE